MRKLEKFGEVEILRGHRIVRTTNLIEASIYLSLGCYMYSYHIENRRVEYQITGDDVEGARRSIESKTATIGIRNFINSLNHIIEMEKSLTKDLEDDNEDEEQGGRQ